MRSIEELLGAHDVAFDWIDEGLRIERSDRTHVGDLERLALLFARTARAERASLVVDHFRPLLDPASLPSTWNEAKPRLKIWIRPRAYLGDSVWPLVTRALTDELIAVLVLDLDDRYHASEHLLDGLDVSAGEAWAAALLNVEREPLVADDRVPIATGGHLRVMFGETGFTSARALVLDRYLDGPAPMGALLSVPTPDALICHVIAEPASLLHALEAMSTEGVRLFSEEERGGLTPHLHWWRDGTWIPVTSFDENGIFRYALPDELSAITSRG